MKGMKTILGAGLALASASVAAQQDFSQVEIVTHQLANNLYYLEGSGGNIGLSVGEDSVFLVDDQYAPLTEKILAAIGGISDRPVEFVLNTHHHGDHTGGNENLGRAGAVIVAHENVRELLMRALRGSDTASVLSSDQRAGLPVVTYSDSVRFHLNGEDIHAFHVGPAHTNGDSFVHFQDANVIHTGDVFRTTGYPVADGNAGGSFLGFIDAYQLLLDISDADTVFLPGHGGLSSQQDVREQLDMLTTIRDRVQEGIDAGRSLEQIQSGNPSAEYDERWGGGRVQGPDLVAGMYNELMAR